MNIEANNEINIEAEYQKRVSEMTPCEKIARMAAMAAWARATIARQIRSEVGPDVSDERIKWLVAMRIYGADPQTKALVQRMLNRVPN